jgi:hypothetical protein
MQNITLSAEDELIARARAKAATENTTLNQKFRAWLSAYVGQDRRAQGYMALMERLEHVRSGRRFTRDEANERR